MTEFVITSSALIAAIILLRHFLKGRISLRLQYALWLLVVLRLLIPFSLPESPISLMNAVEAMHLLPGEPAHINLQEGGIRVPLGISPGSSENEITDIEKRAFTWDSLLKGIWYGGMGVVALCLLSSHLVLRRRLAGSRVRLHVDECPLPVYQTKELPSPCLVGVFRPAIYVTPEIPQGSQGFHHVLIHELTHYRHRDNFWTALRCLCLVVHWYNPLVWLAAMLSRQDAELACDEAAIARIGEGNRAGYGRTLLGLVCEKGSPVNLLYLSTTMTEGKRDIKERIAFIAIRPKTTAKTLIALALISAFAVGCTFTGAKKGPEQGSDDWFVNEGWPIAENFAEANDVVILKDGASVTRYVDGVSADVVFGEEDGRHSVSVTFALGSDGKWAVIPANAATLLDPERWGLSIDFSIELRSDLSDAVVGYAKEYVARQVEFYNEIGKNPPSGSPGPYKVVDGRITGLTPVNTGTAGLTRGVVMYLLEYRLLVDHPDRVVLVGGMKMDEIDGEKWITEWGSTGQPYLLLAWDESGEETLWRRICVTNTDRIVMDYGTPEMLERYGNEFTAAAMELYKEFEAREEP